MKELTIALIFIAVSAVLTATDSNFVTVSLHGLVVTAILMWQYESYNF